MCMQANFQGIEHMGLSAAADVCDCTSRTQMDSLPNTAQYLVTHAHDKSNCWHGPQYMRCASLVLIMHYAKLQAGCFPARPAPVPFWQACRAYAAGGMSTDSRLSVMPNCKLTPNTNTAQHILLGLCPLLLQALWHRHHSAGSHFAMAKHIHQPGICKVRAGSSRSLPVTGCTALAAHQGPIPGVQACSPVGSSKPQYVVATIWGWHRAAGLPGPNCCVHSVTS